MREDLVLEAGSESPLGIFSLLLPLGVLEFVPARMSQAKLTARGLAGLVQVYVWFVHNVCVLRLDNYYSLHY